MLWLVVSMVTNNKRKTNMFIIVIDRDQNNIEDTDHNKVVVNVSSIISVKNDNGFATLILPNERIRCTASFNSILRELGAIENPRITTVKKVRRTRG